MIEFMNSTSKFDLQVLKVEDRIAMIMAEKKVIYKHKYVQSVRSKVETLHKKVQHLKNKFTNLFSKGMPYFQNEQGNLISQEDYHAVQKKSEEDT